MWRAFIPHAAPRASSSQQRAHAGSSSSRGSRPCGGAVAWGAAGGCVGEHGALCLPRGRGRVAGGLRRKKPTAWVGRGGFLFASGKREERREKRARCAPARQSRLRIGGGGEVFGAWRLAAWRLGAWCWSIVRRRSRSEPGSPERAGSGSRAKRAVASFGGSWRAWRRPTLPCLETQYHLRWGV